MRLPLPLALALLALPQDASLIAGDDPSATVRVEHFALELIHGDLEEGFEPLTARGAELSDDEGRPTARHAGVAVCKRRGAGEQRQVEWDVSLPQHDTRVLHVETVGVDFDRLVWREIRAGSGRSLTVDRTHAGLKLREWAGRRGLREELLDAPACLFPLELLEALRGGQRRGGIVEVFDPLSNGSESLEVRERELEPGGEAAAALRRVELVRADGTLAARYLLRGEDLLAFQWQGGRLRARRIDVEEFTELTRPEPEPEDAP